MAATLSEATLLLEMQVLPLHFIAAAAMTTPAAWRTVVVRIEPSPGKVRRTIPAEALHWLAHDFATFRPALSQNWTGRRQGNNCGRPNQER